MLLADGFLEQNESLFQFVERNGTAFQILAAVLATAFSCWFTWRLATKDKPTKTFDFRLQDVAILNERPADTQLRITYEDTELRHPRIVKVQFANSGSEVIRASEILEPYALKVDTRPISVALTSSSRPELAKLTSIEPPPNEGGWWQIPINLDTINPGQSFILQLIVDSEQPIKAGLSGCAENETRPPGLYTTEPHIRALTVEIRAASLGAIALIGLGAWYIVNGFDSGGWSLAIGVLYAVLGVATCWAVLSARAERKRRIAGLPASRSLPG